MALQSSGQIDIVDIQTEFGGSSPISLSEYYGVDDGVPSSGNIKFDDFYGAQASTHDWTIGHRQDSTYSMYGFATFDNDCNSISEGDLSPRTVGTTTFHTFEVYYDNENAYLWSYSNVDENTTNTLHIEIGPYTYNITDFWNDWCATLWKIPVSEDFYNYIKSASGTTISITLEWI